MLLNGNVKSPTVISVLTILDEWLLEGGGPLRLLSRDKRLQGHELAVLKLNINPNITSVWSAVLVRY